MGKAISKLNKEWHLVHPMPKNVTMKERIARILSIQNIAPAELFRKK